MGLYLRATFEVSSITLTGFRQGWVGVVILLPPPPQNEPLKIPPRLGLRLYLEFFLDVEFLLLTIFSRLSSHTGRVALNMLEIFLTLC